MKAECDKGLYVRDAVITDLEALIRIKSSAAVHRDRIRDAAASYMRYFVLEYQFRVIGFVCLVFTRPPAWSDAQDTSHLPQLIDLQIESSLRGRGFGSFLLRTVEQLAAERGYNELYLAVNPVDNPRAHALYLRGGYQPLQAEPYWIHWEFIDSDGDLHQGDGWTLDMVRSLSVVAIEAA